MIVRKAKELMYYFRGVCIDKARLNIRVSSPVCEKKTNYRYFELDEKGVIVKCPRGYTQKWKGVKLEGLEHLPPMMDPVSNKLI